MPPVASTLVLTVHGAALLDDAKPMKRIHPIVIASGKTFKGPACLDKTATPTWTDAEFTLDVTMKSHLYIRIHLIGTRNLFKRTIGHVDVNLGDKHLSKCGKYALNLDLMGGRYKGQVKVTLVLRPATETHDGLEWARRQVAADTTTSSTSKQKKTCQTLLQCVPSWSSREALFKKACGPCFLALVAKQKACGTIDYLDNDTFPGKGSFVYKPTNRLLSDTVSTAGESDLSDDLEDHISFNSLRASTLLDYTSPAAAAAGYLSIEEWMDARRSSLCVQSFTTKPTSTAIASPQTPLLLHIMWLLPLVAIIWDAILVCRL
ncbi:hypothetical protein AC1031_005391 [Aphanomyces cochlioides]|nr:hypothetical protein AC1031_005391 [Aphanomyces cochlioides]